MQSFAFIAIKFFDKVYVWGIAFLHNNVKFDQSVEKYIIFKHASFEEKEIICFLPSHIK